MRYLTIDEAETVRGALRAMYRRCDKANSKDGVGYSKHDADFGKSLGKQVLSGKELSRKQLMSGLSMLQKYREQLVEEGINLPYMDEPMGDNLRSARHALVRSLDHVENDEARDYLLTCLTLTSNCIERIEEDVGE